MNLYQEKVLSGEKFYKDQKPYKIKTEIEGKEGNFTELSTSIIWLYPFWKKTKKKVVIVEKLLDFSSIEKEVSEIKKCV